MADNNKITETIGSLFQGMDSLVSSKTVVGDIIHVGDAVVLPLVDVSFGIGAGAFSDKSGGGGMGGKITPSALLIISNGTTRLVNVKDSSNLDRVINLVPDIIARFAPGSKIDDSVVEEAKKESKKQSKKESK